MCTCIEDETTCWKKNINFFYFKIGRKDFIPTVSGITYVIFKLLNIKKWSIIYCLTAVFKHFSPLF